MSWLEIIELRSSGRKQPHLKELFNKVVSEINALDKEVQASAFSRVTVEADTSIHIRHFTTPVNNSGSPLGQRLASALNEYGYVNHRIWSEVID